MLGTEIFTKRSSGTTAVDGLNRTVAAGEFFALLGPNGPVKTTTIECFLGFLTPDSGRAVIDNLDVAEQPLEARRRPACIPDQVNLYGNFSGVENLAYFSEVAGRRYSDSDLRHFLDEAGLRPEAHDRRVSGYSKGMRRKVGIAIALAKQAKARQFDEPTSGLDPSASHEFSQLLRRPRERGIAILMATHDLFRAKEDATRVGIMRHGKLAHELTAAELSQADLGKSCFETMRA